MKTASVPSAQIPRVDTHLAKFSQACTVALAGLAFVFNQPIIVLIAAIVMTLAALFPTTVSPYRLLYRGIVLPLAYGSRVLSKMILHRIVSRRGVERWFSSRQRSCSSWRRRPLVAWRLDWAVLV